MMERDKEQPDPEPSVSELREEHASLEERLARLEQGLLAVGEEGTSEDLAEMLADLGVFLERHFAMEERSPLYEQLPLHEPRFADRLGRLRAEHEVLQEEVRSLVAAARAADFGPIDTHFADRMRALARRIRAHEHAETEIVQQAWLEDHGEAD